LQDNNSENEDSWGKHYEDEDEDEDESSWDRVQNSQDKNSQYEDVVVNNRVLATLHIGKLPHYVDELSKVSMDVGRDGNRRGGSQAYDWSSKSADYDMSPLSRCN
jgi:hypothetical protein